MASTYHLTEPYADTSRQYVFTGRGGAGNITRNRPSTIFTEPSTTTTTTTNTSLCLVQSQEPYPPPSTLSSTSTRPPRRRNYTFGRGGFGNCHPAAERAMFSFDEELESVRKTVESMAPIYHIGRGGQGNVVYDSDISSKASSTGSSASSTTSSMTSSTAGSDRGFRSTLERVKAHFSRHNSYY